MTTTQFWKKGKYGEMVNRKPVRVCGYPAQVVADEAITCDESVAYEWYADEVVTRENYLRQTRRWSQGAKTYPTLEEAMAVAEEWVRNPGAFTSVEMVLS